MKASHCIPLTPDKEEKSGTDTGFGSTGWLCRNRGQIQLLIQRKQLLGELELVFFFLHLSSS